MTWTALLLMTSTAIFAGLRVGAIVKARTDGKRLRSAVIFASDWLPDHMIRDFLFAALADDRDRMEREFPEYAGFVDDEAGA